jgi:signal recognition particle receptor subunit beta
MVLFNYSTRELTAKIVYYGPGLCGKTTNLQYVHDNLPGDVKGKMLSLATKTDRTLFFDFLPIDLGDIRGMKTRVQLYTVPGQVFYNETRKLVLKGADGIVFVADSQETMLGANVESFKNLEENLKAHGMKLSEMPHVIQFNKRDLPKLASIEDLNATLNKFNAPFYESVATTGIGVQDTLKAIVKLVLLHLTRKYDPKAIPAPAPAFAPAAIAAPVEAKQTAAVARAAAAATPSEAVAAAAPVASAGSMETSRAQVPPPPSFRRTPPPIPADRLPDFGDDEIDGLVGEVEDFAEAPEATPIAARAPIAPIPPLDPEPVVPIASPSVADDEGLWLGTPEDEDADFATEASAFGASASLEDLLAADLEKTNARVAAHPSIPPSVWTPDEAPGSPFEVDRGFDPEWTSEAAPSVPAQPLRRPDVVPVSAPAPVAEAAPWRQEEPEDEAGPMDLPAVPIEASSDDLLLTEVAADDDLFADPSLEIARLQDGEAREIVVPVLLGEGSAAKRYKLSIRLRLDESD